MDHAHSKERLPPKLTDPDRYELKEHMIKYRMPPKVTDYPIGMKKRKMKEVEERH